MPVLAIQYLAQDTEACQVCDRIGPGVPRGAAIVEQIPIARALGSETPTEIVCETCVKAWKFRVVRPILAHLAYRLIAAIHEDVRAILDRMTGIG